MITVTRFPALQSRIVCATIEGTGNVDRGVHLFKPELQVPELEGVSMPEAIVEPKEELHPVVTNHTGGPIQLSKGQMSGGIEEVSPVTSERIAEELVGPPCWMNSQIRNQTKNLCMWLLSKLVNMTEGNSCWMLWGRSKCHLPPGKG